MDNERPTQMERPDRNPRVGEPWGMGMSLLFTAVAVVLHVILLGTIAGVWAMRRAAREGIASAEGVQEILQTDGMGFALATLFSAPVVLGLVVCFVWAKRGVGVGPYLRLKPITRRSLGGTLALTFLFAGLYDLLVVLSDKPIVPQVMVDLYADTVPLFPIWLAFVIAAPVVEETLFRGFLWAGLERSWLGHTGTTVVCALPWALLHVQYDWFGVVSVFALGLVLGFLRSVTGSLLPCIAMHAVINLIATIETHFLAG